MDTFASGKLSKIIDQEINQTLIQNKKNNPTHITTEEIKRVIAVLLKKGKIKYGDDGLETTPLIEKRYKSELDEIRNIKLENNILVDVLTGYKKYLLFTKKHSITPVSLEEFAGGELEIHERFKHIEGNNIEPGVYVKVPGTTKNTFEATKISQLMIILSGRKGIPHDPKKENLTRHYI